MACRWWKPLGARRFDGVPTVGTLVAADHTAWRVVGLVTIDVPVGTDELVFATHTASLRSLVDPDTCQQALCHPYSTWWAYPDEHVPLCSCCMEPVPCRSQLARQAAEEELRRMRRFEVPGVCPACLQPVRARQRKITFAGNLDVPWGPEVCFHTGRAACRAAAVAYEQRWLRVRPEAGRRLAE